MTLGLKLKSTFFLSVLSNQLSLSFSSFSSSFSCNSMLCIGCLVCHELIPIEKSNSKKNKEFLVKNMNCQSFFGKRVIYDCFTSSSMITKFNQYQVHAECRKSFGFLCLVYKTAFKERRNFLKKTGKSEIKMEEVVNVKREEILSSPELKHSKKTL